MIVHIQETKICNLSQEHSFILIGDDSGSISYLDPQNLQVISSYNMHTGPITCLSSLPNGFIASGGHDKLIKVWKHQQESNPLILQGHKDWINSLAALPDKKLASCSDDGQLKIWNLATQECEASIQSDPKSALHILFIPPRHILVSNNNGSVRYWDMLSHKLSLGSQYHEEAITKALFTINGEILTSSTDHTIIFIDKTERILFKGHSGIVFDILEVAPGIIASCSRDGYIYLWHTPKEITVENNAAPCQQKSSQRKSKPHKIQVAKKKQSRNNTKHQPLNNNKR